MKEIHKKGHITNLITCVEIGIELVTLAPNHTKTMIQFELAIYLNTFSADGCRCLFVSWGSLCSSISFFILLFGFIGPTDIFRLFILLSVSLNVKEVF